MKKLMTLLGAIFFVSIFITNCDSGSKKIKLPDPPVDLKYEAVSQIDGPLSEYIEVVPGSYLFEFEKREDEYLLGYGGQMKVKFKLLKPIEIKAGTGYNQYGPCLIGKALDEQGVPLGFELSINASRDLANYLKSGSGEEWLVLEVSGQGSCSDLKEAEKQLKKFKDGKKIRFSSEIIEEKFEKESSSSSSSVSEEDEQNSSGSTDKCDEYLKGYEKFMKDYIAFLKKYKKNPNDPTFLTEYSSMISEASDWASKTTDCASDPKLASKFAGIQLKIAEAASELE